MLLICWQFVQGVLIDDLVLWVDVVCVVVCELDVLLVDLYVCSCVVVQVFGLVGVMLLVQVVFSVVQVSVVLGGIIVGVVFVVGVLVVQNNVVVELMGQVKVVFDYIYFGLDGVVVFVMLVIIELVCEVLVLCFMLIF